MIILQKAIEKAGNSKDKWVKEASALLAIPEMIYKGEKTYTKNPLLMYQRMQKIVEMIVRLGE